MSQTKAKVHIDGKETVSKAAGQAGKSINQLKNTTVGDAKVMTGSMATFAAGVFAAVGAVTAASAAIKNLTDAFSVQEEAEVKRAAALKATNNAVGISIQEMDAFASEMARVTTIADESIIAAQGLMTTFTKIGADVFPQAIEAAADMSAMFGQDLQQSVIQLGTALNDPIAGVGRLKRIGISFSEDQKKMIEQFMEQNDIISAQNVILDELNAEFGGIARAAGEAATGALPQLANAFTDLKEANGQWIIEGAEPVIRKLRDIVDNAAKARMAMNNLRDLNIDYADGDVDAEYSMEELEKMLEESIRLQQRSGWGGSKYLQEQIDLIKILIEYYGEEDSWLIQKREQLAAMERANALLLEQEEEAQRWTKERDPAAD